MVRRKKDQPPMKTYPVRMSEELHKEMQRCAEIADESDSEYIRKAVEMRNAAIRNKSICDDIKKAVDNDINNGRFVVHPANPKSHIAEKQEFRSFPKGK